MAQTNLVGQRILGYTVIEKISSGAFGTVYKVEKVNQSGQYIRALKHITIPTEKQYLSVLNSMGGDVSKADNYFAEMLNDIVSEIQILNHLSERGAGHIVRYYENDITVTEYPKRYDVYILMEYLTPLDDYLIANEFTVGDVLNLASDVLEGLKVCHENGIWHRDIKDDNIFVSENGGYKIGDFGVSKVLKDSSKAESLKGTPNFLAPEVYLGRSGYTETVDLYSLGIVLYRILNYGRNPFLPKFPEQYFSQDEDVAFVKRMAGETPDLPAMGGEKVGEVVVRAIANSRDRYQTAEAFLRDLETAKRDTDSEILLQSVKMEIPMQRPESREGGREQYGETVYGAARSYRAGFKDEDGNSAINRHLFDSISDRSYAGQDAAAQGQVGSWDDDQSDSGKTSENGGQLPENDGQKSEESRKKKRTIIISVSAICAVVAFAVLLKIVLIPNYKYNAAVDLFNGGQYEEAITAFEAMEGYKDSLDQIENCKTAIKDEQYNAAAALYDAGKYTEAIAAFEAMNGYRDSDAQIENCNTAIKDLEYDAALTLYEEGKYEEAITAFEEMNGYRDSKKQIETCKTAIKDEQYNAAVDLYNAEKYEEAIKVFEAMKGYKDSKEQIENCKTAIKDVQYNAAVDLYKAGKYEEAITAFKELDGYRDSAERVKEIGKEHAKAFLKVAQAGDTVVFGEYEQDNNTDNGQEEIEWLVLDREDDQILLISKYALDCQQYHSEREDVTWETCDLRKWLNTNFLWEAFTTEEQMLIAQTSVSADRNPEYDTDPGNTTKDKIFLLSITEAEKYFSSDEVRRCAPTAYAEGQGVWTSSDFTTAGGEATCWWWLRSPGGSGYRAAGVSHDGAVGYYGYLVYHDYLGVRPALWIDLNS